MYLLHDNRSGSKTNPDANQGAFQNRDRILIEASGITDPATISSLMQDPRTLDETCFTCEFLERSLPCWTLSVRKRVKPLAPVRFEDQQRLADLILWEENRPIGSRPGDGAPF